LRKIRLYEIINDDLYCEFLKIDLDKEIERQGFTFSSNIDVLEDLSDEVNNKKKKYNPDEIAEMKEAILKGKMNGWHGEKIKNAIASSNMRHHSQKYDLSCMLLHVREPNPFFCIETNEVLNKSFMMLNGMLMTFFEHLNDFGTICKDTFISLDLVNKIEFNKTKLHKLLFKKMKKWWEDDPNRKKIIIKKEK